MGAVERRHMGIHLGRLDTAVTEQLAHKLQRPPMLEQMRRKAVPKGMTPPNLEQGSTPLRSMSRSMLALTARRVIGKIRSCFPNFPIHRLLGVRVWKSRSRIVMKRLDSQVDFSGIEVIRTVGPIEVVQTQSDASTRQR